MPRHFPDPRTIARQAATKARIVRDFVRQAGVLSTLTARGVTSFLTSLHRYGIGPHVPVFLHAANQPDKLALTGIGPHGVRRLTFRDMRREIHQIGHALGDLGVRPGDRIALMMPNCAEYLLIQHALTSCGASAVQIGYRLKAQEITHILDNARPVAAIIDHAYQGEFNAAREIVGGPADNKILVTRAQGRAIAAGTSYEQALAAHDGRHPPTWGKAKEGSTIIYTSGTTGRPKGAQRSLSDTDITAALQFMTRIGMNHDDRQLVVCPLYHSAAPVIASLSLLLGGSVVVLERFDAERVLEVIESERITCAFMVPTMLRRLVDLPAQRRSVRDTSSLRWVLSGAAALSTDTAVRFQDAFGPILYNFYGSTETGLVTLAEPEHHGRYPGTIGRLLYGNELRLLDDDGNQVPTGEVGELYVKNGTLMTGYHGNREATDAANRDGFFTVGDMARVDGEGFYYLASRKRDMVISGGVNIYPREIENILHNHPDIVEAAVIGVPDDEWGESLAAFVVARPGCELDAAAVAHYCRDNLASYKSPRQVHFIDVLPRTVTGKVLKRNLRELAAQAAR